MDRTDTGDPGKCSKLTLRICVCEAFTCYFLLENGCHSLITATTNRILWFLFMRINNTYQSCPSKEFCLNTHITTIKQYIIIFKTLKWLKSLQRKDRIEFVNIGISIKLQLNNEGSSIILGKGLT